MEIYRGAPALSAFKTTKQLEQLKQAGLPVEELYAEYQHFVDLHNDLTEEHRSVLVQLLKYGPELPAHEPEGALILVTPRIGTISPWASKATDIAHNCGLKASTESSAGQRTI